MLLAGPGRVLTVIPRAGNAFRRFSFMARTIPGRLAELIGPIDVAVILGSGLGGFAHQLRDARSFASPDLPDYPRPEVPGHAGRIFVGAIGGCRVLAFQGRVHAYEGFAWSEVTLPVRLASQCRASCLIVTNAAGGLNPLLTPGDLMLASDVLASPLSPAPFLRGAPPFEHSRIGGLSDSLLEVFRRAAREEKILLREGTYAFISGPSYETRAEIRLLRRCGADAVGMSTLPEIVEGSRAGLRVAALSCITNAAREIRQRTAHAEVTGVAESAGPRLARLLERAIRILHPAASGGQP